MRNKFLIIDGSSLIHRAFYAWPLLTNGEGAFTNAVYGLAIMMNKVLETENPQKVAICFDKSRITFRTALFADYKGTRGATPEELKPQFALAKIMMEKMGVTWEETEGYEADDIIGTLSRLGSAENEVRILTGDRDSFQLIGPHIKVMLTKKGITNTELWDEETLRERYDLTAEQMIDLKALMGDASDNIPGIAGVGEKTALKLLKEFGTLDQILAQAETIKANGLRNKVLSGRESALLSRRLATIDRHMEEKFPQLADLERYHYQKIPLEDNPALIEFYRQMNFSSLLKTVTGKTSQTRQAVNLTQGLFAEEADGKTGVVTDFQQTAVDITTSGCCALCAYQDVLAIQYDRDGQSQIQVAPLAEWAASAEMRRVFADPDLLKLTYQGKVLRVKLHSLGAELRGIADDVELMAYLLDPVAGSYAPHLLGASYLKTPSVDEKKHAREELAALDVGLLSELAQVLRRKLEDEQLLALYQKIELPLSAVLAEMEENGIIVDKEVLRRIDLELSVQEAELTAEIYDMAGRNFNINSPKQLGEVLFTEMGIPPVKKTKTGYSTNQEVLETLKGDYPIAALILQYRTVNKLRSTYAVGLQGLIQSDGRIHTSFNQTVTATGRLSSADPNLQNIPVREEMGRKLRQAFLPQGDHVLISADYSQIELRVLAHISDDKVLQQSFINGEDIHARTAAEVFGVDIQSVTREQRRRAKAVNFGIVYGISDYGLARDLGITRAEGKEYIEKYLAGYDGVRFYMKNIVEEGRKKGYVETLLGRKRWLPDLHNRNYNRRSFAERTALNTPIQGTAADIMKIAMLKINARLKREHLEAKMLLQVHDELILDVPPEEETAVARLLKEEMEQVYPLAVPMTVDLKKGKDWYHMEPFSF